MAACTFPSSARARSAKSFPEFRKSYPASQVHEGVWEGKMAGFPLVFLETEVLWPRGGGNALLPVNTCSEDDAAVRKQKTEEEELI